MSMLSARVTKAIEQSGHNASTAARAIGCTPEAVLQWMNGTTKNLRGEFLFALADLTGFNARWIATGQGPEVDAYRNPKIQQAIKVMENLPEVAQEEALKEIESLAAFLRAESKNRTAQTAKIYYLAIQLTFKFD